MAETFHICAPLATQILKTFNAEAQKRKDMAVRAPQKIFAARDKVGR
jgi:hypothetical protein